MASTTSAVGELPTRQPSAQEKMLIDDILLLYQLHPSEKAYTHYAPNAVFHDPISVAEGLDSIKSQFNGMPKLFAESTTEKCDLLAESNDTKKVINLTQRYVFKSPIPGKSHGTEKTVNSRVTFTLDGHGKVVGHDEEWDHQGNKDSDDGFMGKLMEGRKKMDAKLVHTLVPSDPSKV